MSSYGVAVELRQNDYTDMSLINQWVGDEFLISVSLRQNGGFKKMTVVFIDLKVRRCIKRCIKGNFII